MVDGETKEKDKRKVSQKQEKIKSTQLTIQITRTSELVLGRRYAAPVFSTLYKSEHRGMLMLRLCVAIVFALLVSGCTFSGITKFSEGLQISEAQGAMVTLFSIEPNSINAKDTYQMYGYPVLGSILLNQKDSENLLDILADGVWTWRWRNSILGSEVACFNPRHIVRIQTEKDTFDYVICFQCEGVEVYRNGSQHSYAGILAKQKEFDDVLVHSSVPLATY